MAEKPGTRKTKPSTPSSGAGAKRATGKPGPGKSRPAKAAGGAKGTVPKPVVRAARTSVAPRETRHTRDAAAPRAPEPPGRQASDALSPQRGTATPPTAIGRPASADANPAASRARDPAGAPSAWPHRAPAASWSHGTAGWQPVPAPAVATAPPLEGGATRWQEGGPGPAWPRQPAGFTVVEPDAYARGRTRTIVSNVFLGIDLGLLAVLFLAALFTGIMVVAAPDSGVAQKYHDSLDEPASSGFIILNALLTFFLVGVVPFLWVLGTRVVPWRGTMQYLALRFRPKDWLLGVALVPLMLVSVYVLVIAYTCAVDGCGALDREPESSPMQQLLENLNWGVVIVVALAAGIGEEILFRGVLQRWIGVWGQAAAFGLAHAGNAYPPQVLFAFLLGVAFGYLYRRGWSLTTLIVAHFLYDFVLLAAALLYPELT